MMVAREMAGQAQVSSDHVPSLLGGLFCTLLPNLCQHSTSFSGKVSLVAPKIMALSPHFPGISPPGCHPPEDLVGNEQNRKTAEPSSGARYELSIWLGEKAEGIPAVRWCSPKCLMEYTVQGIQAGSRAGMSTWHSRRGSRPLPLPASPDQSPSQGVYHLICSENSGAGSLGRAGQLSNLHDQLIFDLFRKLSLMRGERSQCVGF